MNHINVKNKQPLQKFVKNVWLVTFSDLIMLILTFFVMLLAMSSLNILKLEKAFKGFRNKGLKETATLTLDGKVILDENELKAIKGISDLQSRNEFLKKIKALSEKDADISINLSENLIKISIANDILFKEGSFELTETSKSKIKELSDLLRDLPYDIVIEGNVNLTMIDNKRIDNYELSLKYGKAVLDEFINDNINPERLAIAGLGNIRSLEENLINIVVEINT